MRRAHILLLGLAMFVPTVCRGQAKCPWMNEATAGGILGGAVIATANVSDKGDGVCEFSRQQGYVVYQLRISVGIMTDIAKQFPSYLAQCPPKSSPVQAVGNEAVTCSVEGKAGGYAEQVVGRVRDRAFVVSVSSSVQNDPSMTPKIRREKADLAAEQLAGILF